MSQRVRRGKFIVLEGTDGSGKTEQFKLLRQFLKKKKCSATAIHFPQHGRPSAYFVEKYLNGEYGTWRTTDPRRISILYAVDRLDATGRIEKWLSQGKLVLSDRYVASNLGHQGGKIANSRRRAEFMRWEYDLEYGVLGIPRPDLNVVLRVPPDVSLRLMKNRSRQAYLAGKRRRDIHEASREHLRQAAAAYQQATELFPREFRVIECAPGGRLLSIAEIHQKVLKLVQPYV